MVERGSIEQARLEGAQLVARTAAHVLNNALSLVVGFAELLGLDPVVMGDPQRADYVHSIQAGAQRAAEFVGRLQQLQRIIEAPSHLGPDRPLLDLERSILPQDPTSEDK